MSAPPDAAPTVRRVERDEPPGAGALWSRVDRADLARVAAVVVCAAVAGLAGARGVQVGAGVAGLVVGCWPIVAEAVGDALARRMSMELSMLIAIAAAAAIGEWATALVITAFALAAEILEELSMDRGRDALTALLEFLPTTVTVRDGDQVRQVPLDEVRTGQVVVISPGGWVPVDGTVVEGRSAVDASRITGESLPVDVAPGAGVYAGSVNQTGVLQVRADRVGARSAYGRIVTAVEQAQATPAPAQRLADRLAGWLVLVALAAAAVTWLVTRDARATIAVVVVAGACGVAAGTPLAVLAGIARAAHGGAFVKGGRHLEALSAVDTVVFDKTGTLTTGELTVLGVHPVPGIPGADLVRAAAGAELHSEHPVGRAVVAHAHALGLRPVEPTRFDYQPGLGVTAQVDGRIVRVGTTTFVPQAAGRPESGSDGSAPAATRLHVAIDDVYAGSILAADTVREDAAACVAALRRIGLRVVMLTGDTAAVAAAVAGQVGIDDVRAQLLPDAKLAAVDAERAAGHRVAMVGDGVNDAPALTRADVGIAMASGTDIARESADVVLIGSDLSDLVATVRTARRARAIVLANVAGTIAVDLVGMTLAAFGLLAPVLAAVVHVTSETAFVLNSARLIPTRHLRPGRAGDAPAD